MNKLHRNLTPNTMVIDYSDKNICPILFNFVMSNFGFVNGTARFKNVNNCLNTNIYFYLETSCGQSSNAYLNVVHFSMPELIRNLWQLKTAVFLHWCQMCVFHCHQFQTSVWIFDFNLFKLKFQFKTANFQYCNYLLYSDLVDWREK
jgi:hypothetical protein